MRKIVVTLGDGVDVDKVETIIAEKLRQLKSPFSIDRKVSITHDQLEAERKFLSKPLLIGKKIAVKVLTARNKHFKTLDKYDLPDKVVVNIEPSTSFGIGTHPTTQMCIEAIERHLPKRASVLDIGCGSGILSIVSLLLGASKAKGVDIDPSAVSASVKNAELNKVKKGFTAIHGDLTHSVSGKYDLILANMLGDPIKALLRNLRDFTHDNSLVILGGILDFRENEIMEIAKKDFEIVEKQSRDNWVGLVLRPRKHEVIGG